MHLGDEPVGAGVNLNAQELATLAQLRRVTFAARQSVDVLGHDHIKPTFLSSRHHARKARAVQGSARFDCITIYSLDVPPVALDQCPALRDLILDRLRILSVGRKASVDRGMLHGSLSVPELVSFRSANILSWSSRAAARASARTKRMMAGSGDRFNEAAAVLLVTCRLLH